GSARSAHDTIATTRSRPLVVGRCALAHAGLRDFVFPLSRPAAAGESGRGTVRGDPARDAGPRRLGHAAAQRRAVFRKAAARLLDGGDRAHALWSRRNGDAPYAGGLRARGSAADLRGGAATLRPRGRDWRGGRAGHVRDVLRARAAAAARHG